MPATKTIKFPLWDGNGSVKLEGREFWDAIAEGIVLKSIGFSDSFNDSSLDSVLWGTHVTGAGTTPETDKLTISAPNAVGDAALVYHKTPLGARATNPFLIQLRHKNNSIPAGDGLRLALYQHSSTPVCVDATGHTERIIALIYQTSTGAIYFGYRHTDGTTGYWYNGSTWGAFDPAYAGTVNTVYSYELDNNGTTLTYRVKNSNGTTLLEASIAWSSVKAEANSLYLALGELRTDTSRATIECYQCNLIRYAQDSPSPGEVWNALPAGSKVKLSTFRVPENMLMGDAGSIEYKYAANGGGFSGWLTQAQMKAQADVTITDAASSIKIVPRYNSAGRFPAASRAYAVIGVELPDADGAGGGTKSRFAQALGVKEGFR